MLGSQVTNKQTSPDPLFLEPYDYNEETTHSDTLSVFLQLKSWLCVGTFCKRTIFCELYAYTRSDVSVCSDNESLDSGSDSGSDSDSDSDSDSGSGSGSDSDSDSDSGSDSDSDVPTTSSRKQLPSSSGPLTPQLPHTFFLTY